MKKFIVKHYSADGRPIIEGNGFGDLEIGGDKEEAEEFIKYINSLIKAGIDEGIFTEGRGL